MLEAKYWLTPDGEIEVPYSEHVDFAIAAMLLLPDRKNAPRQWNVKGVPEHELAAALERPGVDPKAIEFLSKKGNDARLWVLREFGWIRTMKNRWNLWTWDQKTIDVAHNSAVYWKSQYTLTKSDTIDVEEFKTGERYLINAMALRDGGNPRILKNLAMGIEEDRGEVAAPTYSTAKYSELERQKLYGRSGANNPRGSRR